MGIDRNDAGNPIYGCGQMFIAEDTSFIVGESPKVLNITGTLTREGSTKKTPANRGYIVVDGAGDIGVELSLSSDGSSYRTQFTLKQNETFDLTGLEVFYIRLTHLGTDSAYRVNAW